MSTDPLRYVHFKIRVCQLIPYAMCKSIDDGSPVNESPTDQSIMDPLSIDGFSALWIPVSVNPLQIDLGIPSAIYTLIEGSPPLYTDQSRDPLRYIQINLGIPSAIYRLI